MLLKVPNATPIPGLRNHLQSFSAFEIWNCSRSSTFYLLLSLLLLSVYEENAESCVWFGSDVECFMTEIEYEMSCGFPFFMGCSFSIDQITRSAFAPLSSGSSFDLWWFQEHVIEPIDNYRLLPRGNQWLIIQSWIP